jgi:Ser/Thr protein kinase RdoA (MazF antagonist)
MRVHRKAGAVAQLEADQERAVTEAVAGEGDAVSLPLSSLRGRSLEDLRRDAKAKKTEKKG